MSSTYHLLREMYSSDTASQGQGLAPTMNLTTQKGIVQVQVLSPQQPPGALPHVASTKDTSVACYGPFS